MASSWCAENAILSIYQLLDAICSTNLGNQLHYLWIVIASITTNDQEGPLHAFWDREQDRCSEGFRVMRLLKDGDLLAQAGGAWFLVAEGLERDFLDAHRGGAQESRNLGEDVNVLITPAAIKNLNAWSVLIGEIAV